MRSVALLAAIALVLAAVPGAGAKTKPSFDTRYARAFKHAWNHVDPQAPILQAACLHVPHPQKGVTAIEACLIIERTPAKGKPRASTCFEAYLDVTYADPLQAVESAATVACAAARREITAANTKPKAAYAA